MENSPHCEEVEALLFDVFLHLFASLCIQEKGKERGKDKGEGKGKEGKGKSEGKAKADGKGKAEGKGKSKDSCLLNAVASAHQCSGLFDFQVDPKLYTYTYRYHLNINIYRSGWMEGWQEEEKRGQKD